MNRTRSATLLVFLSLAAGCQNMVELRHDQLKAKGPSANMTLQVSDLGVDLRKVRSNEVGAHSVTLFAIPAGDINCEKPLPELMQPLIEEALKTAGYSTIDVRGRRAADIPLLRGEITNFWFAGYAWLWPVFVQAGSIEYHLVLQLPTGKVLWEKTFKTGSGGASVLADGGYDRLVSSALTDLLNQVADATQSPEFGTAMHQVSTP